MIHILGNRTVLCCAHVQILLMMLGHVPVERPIQQVNKAGRKGSRKGNKRPAETWESLIGVKTRSRNN